MPAGFFFGGNPQSVKTTKTHWLGGPRSSAPKSNAGTPGDRQLGVLTKQLQSVLQQSGRYLPPELRRELRKAAKQPEPPPIVPGKARFTRLAHAPDATPRTAIAVRMKPPRRKTVDVIVGERWKRVDATDPLVSGKVVYTPNSTNVHSFWYDFDKEVLYFRFLNDQGNGHRSGPGAVYSYTGVPPHVVQGLIRRKAHPGVWLWDEVRVRGSQWEHRYPYDLVGLNKSNYVPRQAVRAKGSKRSTAYVKRRVQLESTGGWVESVLPNQGTPYRARSATPSRGRS